MQVDRTGRCDISHVVVIMIIVGHCWRMCSGVKFRFTLFLFVSFDDGDDDDDDDDDDCHFVDIQVALI